MRVALSKRAPWRSTIAAACVAFSLCCGVALGSAREPATRVSCICVGGTAVEWIDASTNGPPGRGRLDWPGADRIWRCRPRALPVGAPGHGLRITTSPSNAPLASEL